MRRYVHTPGGEREIKRKKRREEEEKGGIWAFEVSWLN